MMNKTRAAVGFAMKAGKCVSGEFAAERACGGKKAALIVIDPGVSEATLKRWTNRSENLNIPMLTLEDMGQAIGKEARMVAVITDRGFAEMIMNARMNEIDNAKNGGVDEWQKCQRP